MNRATELALRDPLAKAIDATVAADRLRALAALNHMHGLLAQPVESKPPAKRKCKRLQCADCGYLFKWPGQLEDHRRLRHPEALT